MQLDTLLNVLRGNVVLQGLHERSEYVQVKLVPTISPFASICRYYFENIKSHYIGIVFARS